MHYLSPCVFVVARLECYKFLKQTTNSDQLSVPWLPAPVSTRHYIEETRAKRAFSTDVFNLNIGTLYRQLPLHVSRLRLSRITAYLEVKIWSRLKYENLTTGDKILWKRGKIAPPLFQNIFNVSLTSGVKLHIHF